VQDLTTGSLTGHLLKTTGFMLVSMVFQTLYVLVDLYWVGTPRHRCGRRGRAGWQSHLHRPCRHADAGVGTTTLVAHATGARNQTRANLVFNQSQVLSMVVGLLFLIAAYVGAGTVCRDIERGRRNAAAHARVPALVHPFTLTAVRAHRNGIGAARHRGTSSQGMWCRPRPVILNIILAPILVFGWGTGHRARRLGCGARDAHLDRDRRDLDDVLLPALQRVHPVSRFATGRHAWRSGAIC
jgi:Na+-driven multidrug efflux pump